MANVLGTKEHEQSPCRERVRLKITSFPDEFAGLQHRRLRNEPDDALRQHTVLCGGDMLRRYDNLGFATNAVVAKSEQPRRDVEFKALGSPSSRRKELKEAAPQSEGQKRITEHPFATAVIAVQEYHAIRAIFGAMRDINCCSIFNEGV